MARDIADALDIGDARAAEFHDQTRHFVSSVRARLASPSEAAARIEGAVEAGQRRQASRDFACPPPASRADEVARFDALGEDWWDPDGADGAAAPDQSRPHRLARDTLARAFQARTGRRRWRASTILDIGCGAGLLAEPLSRLGARVTGLDPAPAAIDAARAHAEATGAELTYRAGTVEELAREGAQVRRRCWRWRSSSMSRTSPAFVATAASLVAPGGLLCLSTLNRTAEELRARRSSARNTCCAGCRKGTHRWEQFVTPLELTGGAAPRGLRRHGAARAWSSIRCGASGGSPTIWRSTTSSPPSRAAELCGQRSSAARPASVSS